MTDKNAKICFPLFLLSFYFYPPVILSEAKNLGTLLKCRNCAK